jgi:hypothetical protein
MSTDEKFSHPTLALDVSQEYPHHNVIYTGIVYSDSSLAVRLEDVTVNHVSQIKENSEAIMNSEMSILLK